MTWAPGTGTKRRGRALEMGKGAEIARRRDQRGQGRDRRTREKAGRRESGNAHPRGRGRPSPTPHSPLVPALCCFPEARAVRAPPPHACARARTHRWGLGAGGARAWRPRVGAPCTLCARLRARPRPSCRPTQSFFLVFTMDKGGLRRGLRFRQSPSQDTGSQRPGWGSPKASAPGPGGLTKPQG